ncbi:MAG: DeoR family transcriptional regulator [Flavobacteriaceae bacterium]|nr:MAG: DeoR family transcriptional regulator [Flavobacteriaceae bacterium]
MPEQQNIEWKQSWRDEYLQWICGFANANGGVLYIGKDDSGKITGVDKYKKLMDELPNKIKDTTGVVCDVNLQEENNKHFIEIVVNSMSSAISYKGKFYMRSGSTNQLLTGTSLNDFISKSDGKDWEEVTVPNISIEDIDQDAIDHFIQRAKSSGRLPFIEESKDTEAILKNLDLIDVNDKYTRACILLFGKKPRKVAFSGFVKIGKFGKSATDLIFQEEVESNAFQLTNKVLEVLDLKYFIKPISYDGMNRNETPPYPYDAIREVLYNAIIHREYENTPVFISVYHDRINIWNQGELTKKLSIEDLKETHTSHPRNKLMANVFYKAGYIEAWGRGTLKIYQECEKHGLVEPKIENHSSGFSITIFNDIYNEEYISKLDINERQKEAIKYIKENKDITSGQYQDKLNVSKATARRDIEELLELSIIKPEGVGRATKYIIDVEGYNTRR